MKHDHDESHRPIPDYRSSDDENYSELLEWMVKFIKNDKKDVEEDPGELISVIDWIEKSHKLKGLKSMRARVVDQLKTTPRHLVDLFYLMTLMNSEDKQVMAQKVQQYASSNVAIDDLFEDMENYSELMDLAGTELRKIKQQFPNQVGTMATASELHSIAELFLSFNRGLKSLLFKIKMVELHLLYACRPELRMLADRMSSSVEDELEQYEQEVEEAGAKIRQAVVEKKEGDDDDDATTNKHRLFQSLELKVIEWLNIMKASEKRE
ncbi:hypothetical protein ACLB2K_074642 [Fragaria x ananassa]